MLQFHKNLHNDTICAIRGGACEKYIFMNKDTADRFAFGENWQKFLKNITDERIEKAKRSLTGFLGLPDLSGKTFIDIGCGSGLFSYAAFLLKAERILSFDFDPQSVAATRKLWEKGGSPTRWRMEKGSVLDGEYLKTLGTFDIVYSWGVLHHTGSMWDAIRNSAGLVGEGGYYYIALYNNVEGRLGSSFWFGVKKFYNHSPKSVRFLLDWMYILIFHVIANVLRLKNPITAMREYGKSRGMHWREDASDWLGGYPYEYASPGEVFQFMKKEFPSFSLINMKTTSGIGNNWFLFKRL